MGDNSKDIQYIITRIRDPDSIPDTRIFVDRLIVYKDPKIINSLISMVVNVESNFKYWLSDYLYALCFMIDSPYNGGSNNVEDFVRKLGEVLFETNGGEISYYSGVLLGKIDHPKAFPLRIAGVKDDSLFIEGRIGCLNGILDFHSPAEALEVLGMFASNPSSPLQCLCQKILSDGHNRT